MAKNKWLSPVKILLILSVATVIVFVFWYLNRGNFISVENVSPEIFTKIEISYQGGALKIPQLNSGTIFRARIKPSTETDLKVIWTDSSGDSYTRTDLVYLSSVDNDYVRILLQPKGRIKVLHKPKLL